VFERFTDEARRVVVLSQEESRLLEHDHIGTHHLLLGLIHEGDGAAAQALAEIGVTLDGARGQVERIVGRGSSGPVSGHIPFTPGAKKALEQSLREALQLGHNYIGTEHVLLGLLRTDDDPVVGEVLAGLGTDAGAVEQQLVQIIARTRPESIRAMTTAAPAPPFSPELTAVIGEACAAAKAAGATSVKPEHLFDAAARWPDGAAARMVRARGSERASRLLRRRGRAAATRRDEPPEQTDEAVADEPDEGEG
jgi:ATP-dependent Clp protease ATP-binding subunit ClpA